MASLKLVTAAGVVRVNGSEYPVSAGSIGYQAGQFPRMDVTIHENVAMRVRAPKASANKITDKIGDLQSLMFEGRTTPDSVFRLATEGEKNGAVSVRGYLNSPNFKASIGDFGYNYKIVHEASMLSAFSPGAYPYSIRHRFEGIASTLKTKVTDFKSTLQMVIDELADPSKANLDSPEPRLTEIYRANLRELNESAKPKWDEVLSNTEDGIWSEIADLKNYQKEFLIHVVADVYMSSFSGFDSVLASFQSMFQVVYVPPKNLGMGKFIPYKKLVESEEPLELDAGSSNIRTGSRSFLPTTQVSVHAAPTKYHREASSNPPKRPFVASWPDDTAPTGRNHEVAQPKWLKIPEASIKPPSNTGVVNLENYETKTTQVKKEHSELLGDNEATAQILKKYAQNSYYALSLGFSRTTITIPMDLNIMVGKCYNVTLNSDETPGTFTGFLESLHHSMSTTGNNGSATTVLNFSHVQAGSFTLPHIE